MKMKREDFQHSECLIKGNPFGKPDLNRVEVGECTLMVKDVKNKNFFVRWSIGLWLIQNEWTVYSRLRGIEGIPNVVERIDRFAFAIEYIPGSPIRRGEELPSSFFDDLAKVLRKVHSRGVVHLDLRHKGNILISEKGKPFIIDFNSSISFGEKGVLRRFLFPALRWVDYGGLLKLKERVSPSLMTPEESSFLKRFNLLRRLWIFN
jgi:RIO-like serine/threonine protein kinase